MQELKAYQSLGPLKKALDNGGRFYNILDSAGDEVVSRGELAKAAGVFTAGIKAYLFLEMSRQDLSDQDREGVLALLDDKLRKDFAKKKPLHIPASKVDVEHKAGETVIITGYGREVRTEQHFVGFIYVPVMIGKTMVPMMIPIRELYSVIELFEDKQMSTHCAIVCAPAKQKLDLTGPVQFGGVLKELKSKTEESPTHPVFLEAIYWTKR